MNSTLASIAIDSKGSVSYGAALILRDLKGKQQGKCPCYISATTGQSEALVYEFLAEMLALGWVEVSLPEKAAPEFVGIVEESSRASEKASDESRPSVWTKFFRSVGALANTPRYYIRATKAGEAELNRFRPV